MAHTLRSLRYSRPKHLFLQAAVTWIVFAVIATMAGVVRELWLVSLVGDLPAHQIGTLLVCAAFVGIITTFVEQLDLSPREAMIIGIVWLSAALGFELGMGRFVDGLSWARLFSNYDVTRGRLLILVWLTIAACPFLLVRARQR
jgi:hypothetical protein